MSDPKSQASSSGDSTAGAFQLDDILRDVMADTSAEAARKAIAFDIVLNDLEGMTIIGDPQGLRQVLTHVCAAAVASTDHGHVHLVIERLSARSDHILARFAVADTGTGEVRDMAAAKTLVAGMGGELFVTPTPGRGTTVFVILPFATAAVADQA